MAATVFPSCSRTGAWVPACRRLNLAERLLEVGPEGLGILEACAEAEQAGRDALAFPAAATLDEARHAAEGGRVDDHPGRRLHLPRHVGIGDVEREHAPEAGIADGLDGGVRP